MIEPTASEIAQQGQVAQATRAITWDKVHERIAATDAAIADGFQPTTEAKRQILSARAKALAKEHDAQQADDAILEVVEFALAQERYAVEIEHVQDVSGLRELTPLPCVPAFVSGIINMRGQILSVIDLKKFFDLPAHGIADLHQVIIVGNARMQLGILADSVSVVRRVRKTDVQTSLPTLTGIRSDYLLGITADQVVILDVAKILADPRIVVDEEVDS